MTEPVLDDILTVDLPGDAETLTLAASEPGDAGTPTDPAMRRCLVTRAVLDRAGMIRFALDSAGRVLPDVDECLPGRGMWLSAGRDVVNKAVEKRLFGRAARQSVTVLDGLADRIETLLARRFYDGLGLARRAGHIVMGFDQVQACLARSGAAVLLAAGDAAEDGRRKLRHLAPGVPLVSAGSREALGAALGREHLVHAALSPGKLAVRALRDAGRLAGFRPDVDVDMNVVVEEGERSILHRTEPKGTTKTS
ncbi:MAG: RNA-binding protein [Geminicoccaceae bacterium]